MCDQARFRLTAADAGDIDAVLKLALCWRNYNGMSRDIKGEGRSTKMLVVLGVGRRSARLPRNLHACVPARRGSLGHPRPPPSPLASCSQRTTTKLLVKMRRPVVHCKQSLSDSDRKYSSKPKAALRSVCFVAFVRFVLRVAADRKEGVSVFLNRRRDCMAAMLRVC